MSIPTKPKKTGQIIADLMQHLRKLRREDATEDLFHFVVDRINEEIPQTQRPEVLSAIIASTFGRTVEQIDALIRPINRRVEFDALVPTEGWIADYVEWTRNTEPPTVFHFFAACAVIGATLGRNTFFDKGAYRVYPNICAMIIAPTGECRKTSACNMAINLYVKTAGTLLADKTTPEALVDALKDSVNAVGLIYAPELAVFLGKQKYQEGMVPLLTSLFDSPDEWTTRTVGKGDMTLTNVALSSLMCSTMDWIQTALPRDVFGGGFMSRFLFVVQETTSRCFPLPPPRDEKVKKDLIARLLKMRNWKGEMKMTEEAAMWYDRWYRTRPKLSADKQFAGYHERKPDHMIRIATVLAAAQSGEKVLTAPLLKHAERVLTWLEVWLPSTFEEMTSTATGEDNSRIIRHLRHAGGEMEHSALLRKNSSKMNAEMFKRAVGTLREAKLVDYDQQKRSYFLTPEGWGV